MQNNLRNRPRRLSIAEYPLFLEWLENLEKELREKLKFAEHAYNAADLNNLRYIMAFQEGRITTLKEILGDPTQ